jgi:hypothetical protein
MLPVDPVPSWQVYSSATWSGDTLVVNLIGFRDDLWIDWNGSVITESAKVQERGLRWMTRRRIPGMDGHPPAATGHQHRAR